MGVENFTTTIIGKSTGKNGTSLFDFCPPPSMAGDMNLMQWIEYLKKVINLVLNGQIPLEVINTCPEHPIIDPSDNTVEKILTKMLIELQKGSSCSCGRDRSLFLTNRGTGLVWCDSPEGTTNKPAIVYKDSLLNCLDGIIQVQIPRDASGEFTGAFSVPAPIALGASRHYFPKDANNGIYQVGLEESLINVQNNTVEILLPDLTCLAGLYRRLDIIRSDNTSGTIPIRAHPLGGGFYDSATGTNTNRTMALPPYVWVQLYAYGAGQSGWHFHYHDNGANIATLTP